MRRTVNADASIDVYRKGNGYNVSVEMWALRNSENIYGMVYFYCKHNMIAGRKFKECEIEKLALSKSTCKSIINSLHRTWFWRRKTDFIGKAIARDRMQNVYANYFCTVAVTGSEITMQIWLHGKRHTVKGYLEHTADPKYPIFSTKISTV